MTARVDVFGVPYNLDVFTGEATGVGTTAETKVSGDRNGVSSTTVIHRFFHVRFDAGKEKAVHLKNSNFSVSDGNAVSAVFAAKVGSGEEHCIALKNHMTGQALSNSEGIAGATLRWRESFAYQIGLVGITGVIGSIIWMMIAMDFPYIAYIRVWGFAKATWMLISKLLSEGYGQLLIASSTAVGVYVLVFRRAGKQALRLQEAALQLLRESR